MWVAYQNGPTSNMSVTATINFQIWTHNDWGLICESHIKMDLRLTWVFLLPSISRYGHVTIALYIALSRLREIQFGLPNGRTVRYVTNCMSDDWMSASIRIFWVRYFHDIDLASLLLSAHLCRQTTTHYTCFELLSNLCLFVFMKSQKSSSVFSSCTNSEESCKSWILTWCGRACGVSLDTPFS